MKKITLLTLVALTLHFSLHAQLTKNSWMLGGSLGVSSTVNTQYGYGNVTYTQYSIAPKAGYFFIDRLAAGLSVNTSFYHSHYTSTGQYYSSNQNSYGVGPFVRYYFLPIQKTTNIVLEVGDQYNSITYSYNSPGYAKTISKSNSFGFAAGPAMFLTPSVAVELTVGYQWDNGTGKNPPPNMHTFKTAIGLQVYLGGKGHKG